MVADPIFQTPDEDTDEEDETTGQGKLELALDNELLEIAHILPDQFVEVPRADPHQQLHMTGQGHLDLEQVWKEVLHIEDAFLLQDIIPPGLHGENWQKRWWAEELKS